MDIIACLIIIAILTLIKGIARSDTIEPAPPVNLTPVNVKIVGAGVQKAINENRNIQEEIDILGEDVMSIINS